jgi:DNA-binding NtrC family response regulator
MRRLDDSAKNLLLRYRWPGNARELRNLAEQVVVLQRHEVISAEDVKPYLRGISSTGSDLGFLPVPHERMGDGADSRERELIYRALLELRGEVRELKEQIALLLNRSGETWKSSPDVETEPSRYMIVRDEKADPVPSLIEDAAFEIEGSTTPDADMGEYEPMAKEDDSLPTLQTVERSLIEEALERFNGNRRQTAQALGISERTLYRKIKEFEQNGM